MTNLIEKNREDLLIEEAEIDYVFNSIEEEVLHS